MLNLLRQELKQIKIKQKHLENLIKQLEKSIYEKQLPKKIFKFRL